MALLAFIVGVLNSLVQLALIVYLVRTHVDRGRAPIGLTPATSAGGGNADGLPPGLAEPNPLEGLRIGLCVRQDHEHPTFVGILSEKLRGRDALIRLISDDEAAALGKAWDSIQDPPDVLVQGHLTCNGYSDVFYDSGFDCVSRQGRLTTIIEKPSQGGRQFNLADTVIERLRLELVQSKTRDERQRALGELRSEIR